MEIIISQQQAHIPVTIFEVKGLINMGTTAQLDTAAEEAYQAGTRHLLLDLNQVSSLTSAGLRSILRIYKMLKGSTEPGGVAESFTQAKQGRVKSPYLKICRPQASIRKILHIAGFDEWIDIFDSREEALLAF